MRCGWRDHYYLHLRIPPNLTWPSLTRKQRSRFDIPTQNHGRRQTRLGCLAPFLQLFHTPAHTHSLNEVRISGGFPSIHAMALEITLHAAGLRVPGHGACHQSDFPPYPWIDECVRKRSTTSLRACSVGGFGRRESNTGASKKHGAGKDQFSRMDRRQGLIGDACKQRCKAVRSIFAPKPLSTIERAAQVKKNTVSFLLGAFLSCAQRG